MEDPFYVKYLKYKMKYLALKGGNPLNNNLKILYANVGNDDIKNFGKKAAFCHFKGNEPKTSDRTLFQFEQAFKIFIDEQADFFIFCEFCANKISSLMKVVKDYNSITLDGNMKCNIFLIAQNRESRLYEENVKDEKGVLGETMKDIKTKEPKNIDSYYKFFGYIYRRKFSLNIEKTEENIFKECFPLDDNKKCEIEQVSINLEKIQVNSRQDVPTEDVPLTYIIKRSMYSPNADVESKNISDCIIQYCGLGIFNNESNEEIAILIPHIFELTYIDLQIKYIDEKINSLKTNGIDNYIVLGDYNFRNGNIHEDVVSSGDVCESNKLCMVVVDKYESNFFKKTSNTGVKLSTNGKVTVIQRSSIRLPYSNHDLVILEFPASDRQSNPPVSDSQWRLSGPSVSHSQWRRSGPSVSDSQWRRTGPPSWSTLK